MLAEPNASAVTLRGGTISGNKHDGVIAQGGSKITVSEEKPTVCKDNGRNWVTSVHGGGHMGVLEGVAEEKIARDTDEELVIPF